MNFRLPFRTTAARWLGTLILGSLAALGAAQAQGFDARTRTVTVAPSGGDDTQAIRQAFATCIAVGPGCAVQLTEGTFVTRQHVIAGFHGAFVGAGRDRTFIEPLAPLYVTDAEMVLMNHPPDEEPWPTLFLFVDANMTMADLGFRVRDYEITTPWNIYGMSLTALATFVSLTGQNARVDVERISMESGEGTFFGVSVINGLFVQGVLPGPSGGFGDRPPFTGTVTVRDSRFIVPDGGVSIGNVVGATVSVRDSVFDGVFSVFVQELDGSMIEIADNDITTVDTGVWLATGVDLQSTAPSRIVVAGVGGFARGVTVRDNLMRGTADAGVRIGALPPDDAADDDEEAVAPPSADGWVVVGNDLTGLATELAAIYLTDGARDALVVCAGPASVWDEGEGSLTFCD